MATAGPRSPPSPPSGGRVHRGVSTGCLSQLGGLKPSPPSGGRVHRGNLTVIRHNPIDVPRPLLGGEFIEARLSAAYRSSPSALAPFWGASSSRQRASGPRAAHRRALAPFWGASSSRRVIGPAHDGLFRALAPFWGASSSRLRVEPCGLGPRANPRPLLGGEFIEASTPRATPSSASGPSPPSGGRVHRGRVWARVYSTSAVPRPLLGGEFIEARSKRPRKRWRAPALAPFWGASSSRRPEPRRVRPVPRPSPPSGGRVHRGSPTHAMDSVPALPRPLLGGEFIEAPTSHHRSAQSARSPRPLLGGEFIEAPSSRRRD